MLIFLCAETSLTWRSVLFFLFKEQISCQKKTTQLKFLNLEKSRQPIRSGEKRGVILGWSGTRPAGHNRLTLRHERHAELAHDSRTQRILTDECCFEKQEHFLFTFCVNIGGKTRRAVFVHSSFMDVRL